MKKIITLTLFISVFTGLFSQKAVATHEQLETFYKTTTCIVLDDDIFNTYNSAIKTAVEQSWTITPYKFITMEEFKALRQKSEYSFLVRTKVFPENDPDKVVYTFLSLVVGEKDKNFEELPEICSFPLSYYNVDYEKYDYKLGALLLFIENHINLTYNDQTLDETNILQYYNNNIQEIGTKTLYIEAENLASDVNTKTKISKYFSGNIKVSNSDEIMELVDNKDENAVILHIVSPPENASSTGKCYKMLISVADGKLYYFDYHNITKSKPGKFLKTDFSNLDK